MLQVITVKRTLAAQYFDSTYFLLNTHQSVDGTYRKLPLVAGLFEKMKNNNTFNILSAEFIKSD